jgi:hypothetical protein
MRRTASMLCPDLRYASHKSSLQQECNILAYTGLGRLVHVLIVRFSGFHLPCFGPSKVFNTQQSDKQASNASVTTPKNHGRRMVSRELLSRLTTSRKLLVPFQQETPPATPCRGQGPMRVHQDERLRGGP